MYFSNISSRLSYYEMRLTLKLDPLLQILKTLAKRLLKLHNKATTIFDDFLQDILSTLNLAHPLRC